MNYKHAKAITPDIFTFKIRSKVTRSYYKR